jgi:ferredoxin-thioredoxin reductase catalytic subunit
MHENYQFKLKVSKLPIAIDFKSETRMGTIVKKKKVKNCNCRFFVKKKNHPRKICCIQFPPQKYLQKSTSRWCVLIVCESVQREGVVGLLALSFGHESMEGVAQLPVATVEA